MFRPGESRGGVYLRVAVERGIRDAEESTLVYHSPEADIEVGERVEVPLRGSRKPVGGVVVEVGGETILGGLDPGRVKGIQTRTGARLPPDLVELAEWMASYYLCPLGMVMATMMPAAVKHRTGLRKRIGLALHPGAPGARAAPKLSPGARQALDAIGGVEPNAWPVEAKALARRLGLRSVAPLNALVRAGILKEVAFEEVRSRAPALGERETGAPEAPGESPPAPGGPPLTDEQRAACEAIAGAGAGFGVHLLRGVTGSGKTEVYLRVLRRAVDAGYSALVLVPEIALTPQTSRRFVERLGDAGVAVLHSGLSGAERHRQWALASGGQARVVVGARSAVFAPLAHLGVIVVDEEHDGSYKQDQLPRYNARDVAIKRAQLTGARVILGSATPSLESWHNATGPQARYALCEMTRRVGAAQLPEVRVVDLGQAGRRVHGAQGQTVVAISEPLRQAMRATLRDRRQVILLLNRRGYASYVCCASQSCGWRMPCEACDAAMVLHRGRHMPRGQLVRCHHCLAEQLVPAICPVCGKKTISLGLGTQRVEEELAREFGLAAGEDLLRVDSDTMASARDYFAALDRFARGEARVMLGTQMIAKGLDFPGVGLVGVISADTALNLPDFRSAERTFQLVSQVAGRAGRGNEPGLVIVQTMSPGATAIRCAARHDYFGFASAELAVRAGAGLPPLARMARIVCRDTVLGKAEQASETLARALRDGAAAINREAGTGVRERGGRHADQPGPAGANDARGGMPRTPVRRVRIEGPQPCTIARISDHHRIEVIVVAPDAGVLRKVLAPLRDQGLLLSDAHTAIDIDPLVLL